jgi:hypothetical protein
MLFRDLTDETFRTYEFPSGESVTIDKPQSLNVSASGGHRVLDAAGTGHYIPPKWIHLYWGVKIGRKPFAF